MFITVKHLNLNSIICKGFIPTKKKYDMKGRHSLNYINSHLVTLAATPHYIISYIQLNGISFAKICHTGS